MGKVRSTIEYVYPRNIKIVPNRITEDQDAVKTYHTDVIVTYELLGETKEEVELISEKVTLISTSDFQTPTDYLTGVEAKVKEMLTAAKLEYAGYVYKA